MQCMPPQRRSCVCMLRRTSSSPRSTPPPPPPIPRERERGLCPSGLSAGNAVHIFKMWQSVGACEALGAYMKSN